MSSAAFNPPLQCSSPQPSATPKKYPHELRFVLKRNATSPLQKQSDRVLLAIPAHHAAVLFSALETGNLDAEEDKEFITWLAAQGKAYMLVCLCHGGTEPGDGLCVISVIAPKGDATNERTSPVRRLHFRRQSTTHLVRADRLSPDGEPIYEFFPGDLQHRHGCGWLKEKGKRTVIVIDEAKAKRKAAAPPALELQVEEWSFGKRIIDESPPSSSGAQAASHTPDEARVHEMLASDKRKLSTLLKTSGTLCLHGDRTLRGDVEAVQGNLSCLTCVRLPRGAKTAEMFSLCPDDPMVTVRALLGQLKVFYRRGISPIVHVLAVATKIEPLPDGRLRVSTLSATGRRGEIVLPPTVHIWAGNTDRARSPFAVFFRVVLDGKGDAQVVSGYAHPIVSQRQLTLVESNRERGTSRRCLRWHAQLPAWMAARIIFEKVAFTWLVGGHHISIDFAAFFVDDSGARRVLFAIETRGSTDLPYVQRKLFAKDVLEANGIPVVTDGPRPELGNLPAPTLEEQMELAVSGSLFVSHRISVLGDL